MDAIKLEPSLVEKIFEPHRKEECAGALVGNSFGVGDVTDRKVDMAHERKTKAAADAISGAQFCIGGPDMRDVGSCKIFV